MSGGTIHVVGAGLAGLSAAVELAAAGRHVVLSEAAQPGGRCRSFDDPVLGCRIDNGNHLVLSGNREALVYLERIGARDELTGPGEAIFPFLDLASGARWAIRPGQGRIPWWLLDRTRRGPGSLLAHLGALRLLTASAGDSVADRLAANPLYRSLWQPLAVSALNTPAEEGSARAFATVLRGSLARGAGACRPLVPRHGLSACFVDPALAFLARHGAIIARRRLRAIEFQERRLQFEGETIALGPDDGLVLAVPAWSAAQLLPGLEAPVIHRAIVNLHYRHRADLGPAGFLALVGGRAEWLFAHDDVTSATISAAEERPDDAATVWREIAIATGVPEAAVPPHRVLVERRATFAATPAQWSGRPAAETAWTWIALAGDWTDTGLPGTIEGAIRSGRMASRKIFAK